MSIDLSEFTRRTLAPFADPATELDLLSIADGCQFRFVRSGAEIRGVLSFHRDTHFVKVHGVSRQTLASFLAGKSMAGLDELAVVQRRVLREREEGWIAGPARLNSGPPGEADQVLTQAASNASGTTKIVVLDAPAGMGKTALVERYTLALARDYQERRGTRLALLVSSRGRRLSRLSDAIAATLQLLRSPIVFTEVPVLVRQGLITLIIDGFDELVDSDGYESSWSSLAELLGAIDGGGVLVLASRDTFFDEQQFLQRAHRNDLGSSSSLQFDFLRLSPWAALHVRHMFDHLGVDPELTEIAISTLGAGTRALISRPYFAREVALSLKENPGAGQFTEIVRTVVNSFVDRESNLLFGSDGRPNGQAVLLDFFEEVALEMRKQESDSIDIESLRFLLDFVLEAHGVGPELRRERVFRAGSVAFLEIAGSDQKVRRGFPHEVVRDYFFARAVLRALVARDGSVSRVLSAGSVSLDASELVRLLAESVEFPMTYGLCDALLSVARTALPGTSLSANAAAVAFAIAPAIDFAEVGVINATNLTLGNIAVGDCLLPDMDLSGSLVAFLDLTACAALFVRADNSTLIGRLRLSELTIIGETWAAQPACLEVYGDDGSLKAFRDPSHIAIVLAEHTISEGDAGARPINHAQTLLQRIARKWARRFYFCEDDVEDAPMFSDPRWPAVRAILEGHGRLVSKVVAKSGPKRSLVHLRDAQAIAERFSPDPSVMDTVQAIWLEVGRIP